MKKLLYVLFAISIFFNIDLKAETIFGWGNNQTGQLGIGDTWSPMQNTSGTNWSQVSCGYIHNIAIKSDGTLWAWGVNANGQLGDGTTINRSSPVQIGSQANWSQVSCGTSHSIAIKNDGTLWAWGSNYYEIGRAHV